MNQLTVDRFYQLASEGKLVGLKCEAGHNTVPPRPSCRVCQSMNLRTVELTGEGSVVSFTRVYVRSKDFPIDTPYTLALVRLAEGGNLLGVVDDSELNIEHGSKVLIKFKKLHESDKWPRIFFKVAR